jgi:formylmethanofuran dehydrogenase subunit C
MLSNGEGIKVSIMGEVILTPKEVFKVLIDAETISPDKFAGKTIDQIKSLRVYEGGRKRALSDLFNIEGDAGSSPQEVSIVINGDVGKVSRIGELMTAGKIIVNGNAGHYLGFRMKGGSIEVKGNVRMWLGAEMAGGQIEVYGSAQDYVGACLIGKRGKKGMKGGTIIIHGNAGSEIGFSMGGGTIIVDGNAGSLPGVGMMGGTILIKGGCIGKAGARMTGGRIIICGDPGDILPSFYIDEVRPNIKVAGVTYQGPFYTFIGDVLADVKCLGRLMVRNIPSSQQMYINKILS